MAARTRVKLIIFDFDGVVADSEHLAMQVLAEGLSGLGLPVHGLPPFLTAFAHVQRCIASSSKLDYIGRCLDRMLLADWFEHRFSGHDVEHGKPHPDLLL